MEKRDRAVDLHAHTTASDGTFSPRRLVEHAWELGLAAVAVTDHDSVQGVEEALWAGRELGVEAVPGVELSTQLDGREIHVVGLFIDPHCPSLTRQLEERGRERLRRNQELLERLRELGMPISQGEIAPQGGLLTRTHVAEALARRGCAATPMEALEQYLVPGKPAWVEKRTPGVEDCVRVIHEAGGLAVLAHLDRIHKGDMAHSLALAERALAFGMDGLETRYPTYTKEWEALTDALARERGLLPSGGSDFHGERKKNALGTGFGSLYVPLEWLEEMRVVQKGKRPSPCPDGGVVV